LEIEVRKSGWFSQPVRLLGICGSNVRTGLILARTYGLKRLFSMKGELCSGMMANAYKEN
jgi:hypothetical protein